MPPHPRARVIFGGEISETESRDLVTAHALRWFLSGNKKRKLQAWADRAIFSSGESGLLVDHSNASDILTSLVCAARALKRGK